MGAVLGQPKKFQDLGGRCKVDRTSFLFHGEGSDPDGNQAVLAIRQTEPRVSSDFEREPAVTPSVNELAAGRPAQGNAAENERPGIKAQVLSAELALLANEMDGLEFLESPLGEANLWED
jgi:hypothetical protein